MLSQDCLLQRAKASLEVKKELRVSMEEMIRNEEPVKEIISTVKDSMKKNAIPEHEVVVMVSSLTVKIEISWM